MDMPVAAAARRHIVELEKRIADQMALVERLVMAGRNSSQAARTLLVLQQALAVTKEHLRFMLREDVDAHPQAQLAAQ
jgi:hypothetical protein